MIRFGRILLVLVLASLLAAFLAAWLPVDGARFRPAIEQVASRRLGAAIGIDGPIVLRLLPVPTLEAAALRLALPGGSGGTAQSLRLRVALGPLLAGRLAPRELVLRRPRLRLPWPPPLPERLSAPEFSARIEDGALTLGGLTLTALDAALTNDQQTGTAALLGGVRLAGQAWRASASLGRRGGDGSAGLRLTLDDGRASGFAASLSGQVAADGTLVAQVAAHGGDLSRLLPAPAVAFAAEGRLTAAAGRFAFDDVSAELGGAPVHGAIAWRLLPRPRLDIVARTPRLDLDRWLAPVGAARAEPLLRGVPLGLTLSAEAATLSGATLGALRATLDADERGTTLRTLEAVLPGEAPLRLAGKVGRDAGGRLRFDGDGQLVAPDVAMLRGWLARAGVLPQDAFPATALRTLDVAAAIGLDGDRLRFERLRGRADGDAIGGSLTLRRAADGRPTVAATLQLDRLDLDRWLPRAWPNGALPPLDAELRLDAAAASLRGVALGRLRVDVGETRGDVTLRRFEAATADGTLAASGGLSASGRLSDAHLALDLDRLGAVTPWELPGRLGRLPVAVRVAASGRPEALSARIEATLGGLAIAASPRLDLAGAALAWDGPIRLRAPNAQAWLAETGLAEAGLAEAGLGDAAWLGEGGFGAEADVEASAARVTLGSLRASVGALRGGGALQLDLAGPEPALSGHLAAERLPLPGLPSRRDDPLPMGGLRGWSATLAVAADQVTQPELPAMTQASGELALAAGSLRLTGLRARVAGGALSGDIELTSAAQPPRLALRLATRDLGIDGGLTGMPVDLVAGRLDADAALSGAGHSVAALLATVRGTARVDLRDGVLEGIAARGLPPALPDDAVVAALAGGRTAGLRGGVTMRLDNGALAIAEASLAAPGVALGLHGGVDLATAGADLLWSVRPDLPGDPELDLRLTGRLPALARSPELARLARWRVATLPH